MVKSYEWKVKIKRSSEASGAMAAVFVHSADSAEHSGLCDKY